MFKVRVTEYDEKGAAVTGTYYVFESAPAGSNDWGEIMTFRHDDRPGIPSENVRFVKDRIGYLFMGWMYAVTTDSGRNWSVWDATKDLPGWRCCNYALIREVTVHPDGVGKMDLSVVPGRSGEVAELATNDYGKHWTRP